MNRRTGWLTALIAVVTLASVPFHGYGQCDDAAIQSALINQKAGDIEERRATAEQMVSECPSSVGVF